MVQFNTQFPDANKAVSSALGFAQLGQLSQRNKLLEMAQQERQQLQGARQGALGGDFGQLAVIAPQELDIFLEFQSRDQRTSRERLEQSLESGARVMFGASQNPALFSQLRAQHIELFPEDADDFPEVFDPQQAEAAITMATSLKALQAQRQKIAAELRGEQRTISSEERGEQRTISAEGRAEQRKIAGEERATTREFAKPGSPAPLRKEFTALSKDFRKVRDAFGKVQKAAENPSAAGDVSMIFGFMRMLDPASTVREGEFATAQNAAGIPDRIRAFYNRAINGERLAPETRADFLFQARGVFDSELQTHTEREAQFRTLATQNNVDPSRVVIDMVGRFRETGKSSKTKGKIERRGVIPGVGAAVKIDGEWFLDDGSFEDN